MWVFQHFPWWGSWRPEIDSGDDEEKEQMKKAAIKITDGKIPTRLGTEGSYVLRSPIELRLPPQGSQEFSLGLSVGTHAMVCPLDSARKAWIEVNGDIPMLVEPNTTITVSVKNRLGVLPMKIMEGEAIARLVVLETRELDLTRKRVA